MEDWIVNSVMDVFDKITKMGSDVINTPETFNSTIYNGISDIQKNVITPIALVVLAIFLLIELQAVTTRTDNMGERGFEIPFKIMIKFAICKVVLESTPLILSAIFNVTQDIIINMNTYLSGSAAFNTGNAEETIRQLVNNSEFLEKVLIMLNVFIINIVSLISGILVTAITYGRMIEMYIFIGIAPLPMATIPNAEHSSIAKNFLKSFTAVSIQGVLICLTFAIMKILFNEIVTLDTSNINIISLHKLLWQCTGYSIITVFALLNSGKWAKSICNAM
ncbi:MAG: CD0415/CD1112 family protein [Clostridium sp.]|uniref:VirB6/TrbL-like conjugal transfer protein, CD1112 family n=1 Tax=Clostridium sp. TaxID=1506 RepID=UPI002A913DE2|nr:CD0415/CD1112 family protein [Clostridium sp.]MDY6228815.1 CD0415/CD1112 family protein [Clostridium sp.]